jgi:hypothetical protein
VPIYQTPLWNRRRTYNSI